MVLNNVEVASFTEPDLGDAANEFSEFINWGDGTPLDATGQIVGSSGLYHILGSHTYATAGFYSIQVEILQHWAAAAVGAVQADKADAKNPVGPSIVGPEVVAGRSAYQYQVNNPGGKVLSWSVTGDLAQRTWLWQTWPPFNDTLGWPKSEATHLGWDLGKFPGPSFQGDYDIMGAHFGNNMAGGASGKIVVTIQPQGGGKPITISRNVTYFGVLVADTVFNANVKGSVPSFSEGKVNGLKHIAQPAQEHPNFIINGEEVSVPGNRIVAGSPQIPGMSWNVYVKLMGPNDLKGDALTAALRKLQIGFIQSVHVDAMRVAFPGQELVASVEGRTMLDARQRANPWYALFSRSGQQIEAINANLDKQNLGWGDLPTLSQNDTPSIPYPVGLKSGQATGYFVQIRETFETDLAVQSLDAPTNYWPQARLNWQWDGSGTLSPGSGALERDWEPLYIPISINPLRFKQATGLIFLLNPQPGKWLRNNGENMPFPEFLNLPLAQDNTGVPWRSRAQ